MKKIISYSVVALMSAAALVSCRERDVVAPTVVQQSNTPNGVFNFNVAIFVRPDATKGAKTELFKKDAIRVTLSQGTTTQSALVGEDGIANFSNISEGEVAYAVTTADSNGIGGVKYAKRSGKITVALPTNQDRKNQSNQTFAVTETVDLPQMTANVTGKIVGDFDFLPGNALAGDAEMEVRLDYGNSYEPNFYIVKANAAGEFTFANVPAATATVSAKVLKTNGTDKVTFEYTGNSITLKAVSSTNIGTVAATAAVVNNATIKGIVYGDFGGILTVNGVALVDGLGNPLKAAPNQANYNAINSVTGTTLGFSSTFTRADVIVKAVFNGTGSAPSTYEVKTAADGTFTLSNVPAGKTYDLTVTVQITPTVAPTTGSNAGLLITKTFNLKTAITGRAGITATQIDDLGAIEVQ